MTQEVWDANESKMYELRGRFVESMCDVEDGIDGVIASRWCVPEDQYDFVAAFVAKTPQWGKRKPCVESLVALGWEPDRAEQFAKDLFELVDWRNRMAHGRYYACGLQYDESGEQLPADRVPYTILLNGRADSMRQLDRAQLEALLDRANAASASLREIIDEWRPKRPARPSGN